MSPNPSPAVAPFINFIMFCDTGDFISLGEGSPQRKWSEQKLHDAPWQKQAENSGLLLPHHNPLARRAHEQNSITLPLPHVLAVPLQPGKAAQRWHSTQKAAFKSSPIHDGWPQTWVLCPPAAQDGPWRLPAASQLPRATQHSRKGSFKLEWNEWTKGKILSPQHQYKEGCRQTSRYLFLSLSLTCYGLHCTFNVPPKHMHLPPWRMKPVLMSDLLNATWVSASAPNHPFLCI